VINFRVVQSVNTNAKLFPMVAIRFLFFVSKPCNHLPELPVPKGMLIKINGEKF